MRRIHVSIGKLMDESEAYIDAVWRYGRTPQRKILNRLFDSPKIYNQWESAHYCLMKSVAENTSPGVEVARMRQACFALVHRRALFEYLRSHNVTGANREAIFSTIYRTVDYTNAVVTEHGRYQRSTWSLLCTDHLDLKMLRDREFVKDLPEYEDTYSQYIATYCEQVIAERNGVDDSGEWFIGYTKWLAAEKRREMMRQPIL